jgi:hypothetical protein
MDIDAFTAMQVELFAHFGWLARWWLILFAAGGVLIAAFAFFFTVLSHWMDNSSW